MKIKISRNAAKVLQKELAMEENQGLYVRVGISHSHGDHAHYALGLDSPQDQDEIVDGDHGIQVLLKRDEPMLDGVRIDYFYLPNEGFAITNPSKGNHGDH